MENDRAVKCSDCVFVWMEKFSTFFFLSESLFVRKFLGLKYHAYNFYNVGANTTVVVGKFVSRPVELTLFPSNSLQDFPFLVKTNVTILLCTFFCF